MRTALLVLATLAVAAWCVEDICFTSLLGGQLCSVSSWSAYPVLPPYTVPDVFTSTYTDPGTKAYNSILSEINAAHKSFFAGTQQTLPSTYTTGSPILAQPSTATHSTVFSLPGAGFSSYCSDAKVVGFDEPTTSECYVALSSLAAQCTAEPLLDATQYVGMTLSASPGGSAITVTAGTSYTLDRATGIKTPGACPAPSYGAPTCSNALAGGEYVVNLDAAGAIASAVFDPVCAPLTTSDTRVRLEFIVTFVHAGSTQAATFTASGSPGYIAGSPVRAGIVSGSAVDTAQIFHTLRLPLAQAGGSCPGEDQPFGLPSSLAAPFGIDTRSSCSLASTAAYMAGSCPALRATALNILWGETATQPTHLAPYGNTVFSAGDDWVAIDRPTKPTPSSAAGAAGFCSDVPTRVVYDIVVGRSGASTTPDMRIVSAKLTVYNTDVRLGGVVPHAAVGSTEAAATLTWEVRFTELEQSTSALPTVTAPSFLPTLPDDIFYPLTG